MRNERLLVFVFGPLFLIACDDPPSPQPYPQPVSAPRLQYRFSFEHTRTIKTAGTVVSPTFSPDGKYILAISGVAGVGVWDAATAEPVRADAFWGDVFKKPVTMRFGAAAFSPSGKWLLVASGEPPTLELVDWTTKKRHATVDPVALGAAVHRRSPVNVIFSPGEAYAAIGWEMGEIHVLRIPDLSTAMVLHEGACGVPVAFSDDRRQLVTAGGPHPAPANEAVPPDWAPKESEPDVLLRERGLRLWSTGPWRLERVQFDADVDGFGVGAYDGDQALSISAPRDRNASVLKLWDLKSLEMKSQREVDAVPYKPQWYTGWSAHAPTGYIAFLEATQTEGQKDAFRGVSVLDPGGEGRQDVALRKAMFDAYGAPGEGEPSVELSAGSFSQDGRRFVVGLGDSLLIYRVEWERRP